jgi:hypothetical protein
MTEITKAMSSTTELITRLLLYVAMISLMVGDRCSRAVFDPLQMICPVVTGLAGLS